MEKFSVYDYPKLLINGEVHYLVPLDDHDEGSKCYVTVTEDMLETMWWKGGNHWVDTHIVLNSTPPKVEITV